MTTMLSEHFSLEEACKSQVALRLGIANTPNGPTTAKLKRVAHHILEPCRARFGAPFTPSSWYRSRMLNKTIGGKDRSQHVKGEAVDFEIPGIDNVRLATWIRDHLDFDQLILEHYEPGLPSSGWVHCSYVSPKANRKQCLMLTGGAYLNGLPD